MTNIHKTTGRTAQFHHQLEPTGSGFIRPIPHQQQILTSLSQASTRREIELWGLTDLPDDVSVRHHGPTTRDVIESILVPIAGGPNSHAAVRVSAKLARDWDARLELLTVVAADADNARRTKAETRLYNHADDITNVEIGVEVVASDDVMTTIGQRGQEHELIVIGDSERSVFQRILTGGVPKRLRAETDVPIFVVERTEQ